MFKASANAYSSDYCSSNDLVTATASSFGFSYISQKKAIEKAEFNANQISNTTCQNNINIINQSLEIINESKVSNSSTVYFNNMNDLNAFQLPNGKNNDNYSIITNIKNYEAIDIDNKTSLNLICLDYSETYLFTVYASQNNLYYNTISCYNTITKEYIILNQLKSSTFEVQINAIIVDKYNNIYIGLHGNNDNGTLWYYQNFLNQDSENIWHTIECSNNIYTFLINENTLFIGAGISYESNKDYACVESIPLNSAGLNWGEYNPQFTNYNFTDPPPHVPIIFLAYDNNNNLYATGGEQFIYYTNLTNVFTGWNNFSFENTIFSGNVNDLAYDSNNNILYINIRT